MVAPLTKQAQVKSDWFYKYSRISLKQFQYFLKLNKHKHPPQLLPLVADFIILEGIPRLDQFFLEGFSRQRVWEPLLQLT